MTKVNPITDPNARMITGPVNVIRMEGDLYGIKKVIYLFMDYHIEVDAQTQCKNVFSSDIQKYFVNNFHRLSRTDSTRMYDFFPEVFPSELVETKNYKHASQDYREKYIEEVVKFFVKIFKYDPEKNKVTVNEMFKNVRLHYIDIRDYFKHTISHKMFEMSDIVHKFMKLDYIDTDDLEYVIGLMGLMHDHLQLTVDILSKENQHITKKKVIKENVTRSVDIKTMKYLANKIRNVYKHKGVKQIMNYLIDDITEKIKKTITDINSVIKRFNGYKKNILDSNGKLVRDVNTSYVYGYGLSVYTIRNMIVDIVNTVERLVEENFIEFFAIITDIFFMRRFLDKDYITNAVTYTGAMHSNMYIHTLIKHFGFKITHASYAKIRNMEKLTTEIRKRSLIETQELILPERLIQCSDMSSFPEEFL
jgi:hypothetical protein